MSVPGFNLLDPVSRRLEGEELQRTARILYVSSVDVSVGSGPGVNERDFILALYRAVGRKARFLIPKPARPVPDLPVDACIFSRPHNNHHPARYLAHLVSQARLGTKILAEGSFDLLVLRLDILPAGALFITSRATMPYTLKTLGQGEMEALLERGGVLGRLLQKPHGAIVRRLVKGSLVTDACSTAMVEYLRKRLDVRPDLLVWIDNGADVSRFVPGATEEARQAVGMRDFQPILGYVGSRPSERGARQMIEAAPRLKDRFPRLGLLVVGHDPSVPTLQALASDLGVAERVRFAGYVPFDAVPRYVNALDVGVSISDRGNRFAAAELKVRQYLACGKPVVASPGSNDFLSAENLGSIVPADDPEAIRERLEAWLALDPTERAEFAARARAFVESRLSSDAIMKQRFQLWAERLSRPAAVPSDVL